MAVAVAIMAHQVPPSDYPYTVGHFAHPLPLQEDPLVLDSAAPAQRSSPSQIKRRSSTKIPGILKRASSSPNIRSIGSDDSGSNVDKKRNKLGYHRTAVACGHCRRRKIRCIPAFEDINGRCQNCIRLKKDCHFFPVDQQGITPGKRTRSSSKAEAMAVEGDASVGSASPGVLGSSSLEQIKQVNGQIGTPPILPESSTFPPFLSSAEAGGHNDTSHIDQYSYRHSFDQHSQSLPSYSTQLEDRNVLDADQTPLYHSQEPQTLQAAFTTQPFTSGSYSHTISSPALHNLYQMPPAAQGSEEINWRKLNVPDVPNPQNSYGAYRAHSFPTPDHPMRATQDWTRAGHMRGLMAPIQMNMQDQHADAHSFSTTSAQNLMAWQNQIPAQSMHLPEHSAPNYGQQWYDATGSSLPYVREEDDGQHFSQPHGSLPPHFRPHLR